MSSLREECGIFGVFGSHTQNVASTTYYGLFALQHRGQESCGIVVNDDGVFESYKDSGIVNDVFTPSILENLGEGNMALGHVRYGTSGKNDRLNSQPIVVNHHKGRLAIAHNGSLVNAYELRKELEEEGFIFHTTGDCEIIASVIIKERIRTNSIEDAVNAAMEKLDGAYALTIMSPSKMIAARDELGMRPLCYGIREDGTYIVASETCALNAVDAKYVRDIEPGEIVIFDKDGVRSIKDHMNRQPHKICIFEYIYFARPDSVIEGKGVHEARLRAGACLAMEHPVQADVVIGVPDSGLDAALGFARQSGIPYGIGFIKNKYIGRTFIAPGQSVREDKVKIKLNVLGDTVKDKRVVLVDDSIVRGTTIAKIVNLLRDAGAKEVHVRSSAPPFINPCYYGTDIDSKDKLIACKYSVPEIREIINADSLGYLSINSLGMLIGAKPGEGFCQACFTGEYPTKVPNADIKNKYEQKIGKFNE